MVKLMGHLGMALLWAAPAWFLWDGRETLVFVALVLSTAMLPDVDLVLTEVLPVTHHGITHTVLFVLVASLVAGAVVESTARARLASLLRSHRGDPLPGGTLFLFVASGFFLGGLSHLFTDMLSAPDIAPPLEPFWPLIDKPWSLDLIYYSAFRWNVGLLALGIALHVVVAVLDVKIDHPYHFSGDS